MRSPKECPGLDPHLTEWPPTLLRPHLHKQPQHPTWVRHSKWQGRRPSRRHVVPVLDPETGDITASVPFADSEKPQS